MEDLLRDQINLHGRLLFRMAYGILRNTEASEDVCQQTFLKAWSQRGQIREKTMLKSWLTRVVLNESFQVLRKKKLEKRILNENMKLQPLGNKEEKNFDMREAVLEALEKLPEPTRTVVTLRVMNGVSGNEVRELLNCSASEVSRRLHDGMEQLRRLLSEWKTKDGG